MIMIKKKARRCRRFNPMVDSDILAGPAGSRVATGALRLVRWSENWDSTSGCCAAAVNYDSVARP